MKKLLAFFLSAIMLCTALFTAVPVLAANSDSLEATPLTGYTTSNSWQYDANQVFPKATENFTTAGGVKLSENYKGEINLMDDINNSYIYLMANYAENTTDAYRLPENFATNGSFIVYIKTDSANKMRFSAKTECPSQWFTTGTISANAGYEYLSLGNNEWTSATADENGAIGFTGAFDGYVKIPVTSLKSMDNVTMTFNYLAFLDIRLGGIGGQFGSVTEGPFFVTTSDSASTKITVSEEYQPEPILATPLTGYNINSTWQYDKALIIPEATKKLTSANGIKLTENNNGVINLIGNGYNSSISASGTYKENSTDAFALSENFADNGSFMIYVKTDSANEIALMIRTECPSLWFTTAKINANSNYKYVSVGNDKWTSATTDGNGVISFDSAFEGYVKIPATAMTSLDSVPLAYKHLSYIDVRVGGIGGDFGSVITGPFFVTTSDSPSVKITVPEEYQPEPILATPLTGYTTSNSWQYDANHVFPEATEKLTTADGVKLSENYNGEINLMDNINNSYIYLMANYAENTTASYRLPENFATNGSFIVYIKTDSANKMRFSAKTECPSEWFTTGTISANAEYEYLSLGNNEWTSATADENGAISFTGAFDGYVKIPVTSLKSMDNVTMTFNYLAFLDIRLGGIGGQFGSVTEGPFFVTTSDSPSAKINVPTEYQPAPLEIKSFDFGEVRASGYNFSAQKLENTNNYTLFIGDSVLSDTPVKHQDGVDKWSYVENADGIEASDGATALIMNPTVKTYMKDAEGIVFYVNFKKANMFAPCIVFEGTDILMLQPGKNVYLLANGANDWTQKAVDKGYQTNELIYGKVIFDDAFEGYIKVPFTSLNNDGGFKPTLSGDNMSGVTSIVLRFKGIGDDTLYGSEVVAGVSGYYTADTAKPAIGTISVPDYPIGDANYDWKVNADDLICIRKTLLGGKYTGYEVSILDLVRVKKILATVM